MTMARRVVLMGVGGAVSRRTASLILGVEVGNDISGGRDDEDEGGCDPEGTVKVRVLFGCFEEVALVEPHRGVSDTLDHVNRIHVEVKAVAINRENTREGRIRVRRAPGGLGAGGGGGGRRRGGTRGSGGVRRGLR